MNNHCVYDSCFFKLLNRKFGRQLERALRRRCTLLIPADGSFAAESVDAAFVGYHIVRPSPLYADHFDACCGGSSTGRSSPGAGRKPLVEWDREKSILITTSGFPCSKQVEVLANEVAYNESLQTYNIFLISEPLHTAPNPRRPRSPAAKGNGRPRSYREYILSTCRSSDGRYSGTMDELTAGSGGPAAPPSQQEARTYLFSVPVLAPALKVIDEKVEHFNNNYVILPNFINDTVDKLRSISDTAIQVLTCNSPGDEAQLSSCIDNYVSGLAHHKVFGSVKSFCRTTDADLERRLEFLRTSHVTAETLGVREEAFHCELPQAIVELASLDAKYTPVDKLWCLRSTLRSVQMEVEEHCHQSGVQFYYGEDMPALTSEVLIPLVVLVMARSRPMYLSSNIFYIDHFCGVKDDFSSFTISTFKAACEFVRKFNGIGLEQGLSPRMLKKELSLVDLMEVTASINESSSNSSLAIEPKTDDEADGDHVGDDHQLLSQPQQQQQGQSQQPQQPPEQQQHQAEHTNAQQLQQSPLQRKSPVRNSRLRSSLGRGSGGGASGLTGPSYTGVDRKLEEITRLIEQQTLDFHSKEEERLRRLDNNHTGKSSIAGQSYGPSPSSSSLNSSSNSVAGSSEEAPNLLFSPLTSLRRSLRQQRNS